jgi:decaprenyl-phosphate phosphoribosyltransferase
MKGAGGDARRPAVRPILVPIASQMTTHATSAGWGAGGKAGALVQLARPRQWSKTVFVLIGPAYALADPGGPGVMWGALLACVAAFGLAASGCYAINDIRDAPSDRTHPRKRHRPVASGRLSERAAWGWAWTLLAAAGASVLLVGLAGWERAAWVGVLVGAYVLNVSAYTFGVKRIVVLDVVSLAVGFVIRVLGGCVAAGVEPSPWLLNTTFFLSMFLAFGKRLGERRTMGTDAAAAREAQSRYTDDLLRMLVVVTAVATLMTYAGYVQARAAGAGAGMVPFWLTLLPATYGLLRCMVLLERGAFDDPTELAAGDRGFQAAVALFVLSTVVAAVLRA